MEQKNKLMKVLDTAFDRNLNFDINLGRVAFNEIFMFRWGSYFGGKILLMLRRLT
jgi:hypothetical protein